ncbi:hypothetical protein F2Q69_00049372 [Brassica cretica]|uniref:Uncharacterized protein n=1 Tax=Brassica cretica TaxID=69181 RepID=A0A8S9PT89_BRACR|nr:hypothetical protein F2Q69_00049372 [Brassica cretica]
MVSVPPPARGKDNVQSQGLVSGDLHQLQHGKAPPSGSEGTVLMATWHDSIGERIGVVAKHRLLSLFLLSLFLLSSPATKWRFLFFSVALLNQRHVFRWLMSTTENGVPSNGCSHPPRETGRCLSWLVSETKQNGDCR